MKIIPNYHPPADYRRPTKTQEKVYVPVNDYPEINFSMITNLLTLFLFFPLGDHGSILACNELSPLTLTNVLALIFPSFTRIYLTAETNT